MRRLTIFDWFGVVLPMEEKYKLIKQAGFDGVMTWWGDDGNYGDEYKQYPALARAAGLYVENVHTPFDAVNNVWLDNLNGEAYIDNLIKYADELADHEIPTMVVHVSKSYDPPPVSEIGLNRFKRLCEAAERRRINVAIENLKRADYTRAVFENIDSPYLKFCYDTGHNNCNDKNVDYLNLYGDKLAALHLHDNDGTSDLHLAPFTGTANWDLVTQRLKATGYDGAVALEVFCGDGKLPYGNAEQLLAFAHDAAVKLRTMIDGK